MLYSFHSLCIVVNNCTLGKDTVQNNTYTHFQSRVFNDVTIVIDKKQVSIISNLNCLIEMRIKRFWVGVRILQDISFTLTKISQHIDRN